MADGCMTTNGVLKDGKLTPEFKAATIERLKKMSKEGSKSGNPLLSGCKFADAIPPSDVIPDDIEDEEKYPEFHKDVWKLYEDALKSFDIEGNFSLPPPIMDPTALVNKLGGDTSKVSYDITGLPSLNPAELGMILADGGLEDLSIPVKFTAEIPKLVTPPLVVTMPDTLGLNLPVPELNLDINLPLGSGFSEKFEVDSWPIAVIKAFPDVVTGLLDPGNLFKLATEIPASPCFAIEPLVEGNAFGPSDDGDKMKKIVQQDLASVTGKAATVAAASQVIGDGGKPGLTGKLCRDFELVAEPPPPAGPAGLSRVRQAWLKNLRRYIGPLDPAWEGDPNRTGMVGVISAGAAGEAVEGLPGEVLVPGYKPNTPPKKGPGGGNVTFCGLMPSRVMQLFSKDPEAKTEFQFDYVAKEIGVNLAQGPQGCYVLSKFLRAYTPCTPDVLPKPGDLYFVDDGAGSLLHVGIIFRVDDMGDQVNLIVGDGGQGPAVRQENAWVAKTYYKSTRLLIGSNGEGADGVGDGTDTSRQTGGKSKSTGKGTRYMSGFGNIDLIIGRCYSLKKDDPSKTEYYEAWSIQTSTGYSNLVWQWDHGFQDNEEKKAVKTEVPIKLV